ncbi:MAG: undecaprenyl-diphosphate phosphatase [Holosporaceae bacterium]|jgi:undecaprenyl-diphosphatase|nr:undecaprenyl-diphosphate phosphatase [Holosporaceae bacterium]
MTMTYFQAIFLGALQGVTEFLPVSSSAHLVVFSKLLEIPYQGKTFDIFLNSGTLLAILVFFRRRVYGLLMGVVDFLLRKKTENRYFFVTVVLSSLPVVVIFGFLEMVFPVDVTSEIILAWSLIFFAVVLLWCDANPVSRRNISRMDSLLVGLLQPLSIIPGISRLGLCLSVMRYMKYSREESFKYSMILSIPPVCGACILKIAQICIGGMHGVDWSLVAVGSFSSFICGVITLFTTVKFMKKYTLLPIIVYRILLGSYILLSN